MKSFIIYNKNGNILRTGCCKDSTFQKQARQDEFVVEGIANDVTQKIIDGKVIDKTPEEIEKENPPPLVIPEKKRPAQISNEQWQDALKRLSELENRSIKIGE